MHTVKAALEELMASMDRVDAHVIMAEVLGVNRAWIAANPQAEQLASLAQSA